MIRSDFHMHSEFSGDSTEKMEDIIEYSIAQQMERICFTEHLDIDLPGFPTKYLLDFEGYRRKFEIMRERYQKRIKLLFGIELGIQEHLYARYEEITRKYPFDFVLCSSHVAGGMDPYFPEFYEGRTREEGYRLYFGEILKHVRNYQAYDAYGHLDYAIRYAPFEEKKYAYRDYQDILDEILKTVIQNGKGIELNASGYKFNLNDSTPSYQVFKRYKELGGEIITVGSDAHKKEQIQNYFELARDVLLKAGFVYYTIFEERKPTMIPL